MQLPHADHLAHPFSFQSPRATRQLIYAFATHVLPTPFRLRNNKQRHEAPHPATETRNMLERTAKVDEARNLCCSLLLLT